MGLGVNDYCRTVTEGRALENVGVVGRIMELRDIGWLNVG